MHGSLGGTTKVVAGGLALASLLCWAPGSRAAVYTGSATDPSGDMTREEEGDLPDPAVDFTNVAVRYDSAVGRVDVTYTFAETPRSYHVINAGVGLGSTHPDGDCRAPFTISQDWASGSDSHGEAVVKGRSSNFSGVVTGSLWDPDQVPLDGDTFSEWSGRTWRFETTDAVLAGKQYTCARPVVWVSEDGSGGHTNTGVGRDDLATDAFALNAEPLPVGTLPPPSPEPVSVPPTASTGSQPSTPASPFTAKKARKALTKALASRYGKTFLKRTAYTAECLRTSASRWDCSVRWSYGRLVYKGKIKLMLRSDGRIVSRASLRKVIK